jgi:hypothetical protein
MKIQLSAHFTKNPTIIGEVKNSTWQQHRLWDAVLQVSKS